MTSPVNNQSAPPPFRSWELEALDAETFAAAVLAEGAMPPPPPGTLPVSDPPPQEGGPAPSVPAPQGPPSQINVVLPRSDVPLPRAGEARGQLPFFVEAAPAAAPSRKREADPLSQPEKRSRVDPSAPPLPTSLPPPEGEELVDMLWNQMSGGRAGRSSPYDPLRLIQTRLAHNAAGVALMEKASRERIVALLAEPRGEENLLAAFSERQRQLPHPFYRVLFLVGLVSTFATHAEHRPSITRILAGKIVAGKRLSPADPFYTQVWKSIDTMKQNGLLSSAFHHALRQRLGDLHDEARA